MLIYIQCYTCDGSNLFLPYQGVINTIDSKSQTGRTKEIWRTRVGIPLLFPGYPGTTTSTTPGTGKDAFVSKYHVVRFAIPNWLGLVVGISIVFYQPVPGYSSYPGSNNTDS
eukprot:634578-Rhodomonas_salina.1